MLLVIFATLISLAHCSQADLFFSKTYGVTLAKDPKLGLSLDGDMAVLNASANSPVKISPKSGTSDQKYNYGDPVNLLINGQKMCSNDGKLQVCKGSKNDEFRIKTKGEGYRIKTEEGGKIKKFLREKCLEKDDGKLKMKRCDDKEKSQIFMFKELENADPASGNAPGKNGPQQNGGFSKNGAPCNNSNCNCKGPATFNVSNPASPEISVDGKPFHFDSC